MVDKHDIVKKIVESLREDVEGNGDFLIKEIEKIRHKDSKAGYRDLLKIFTHLDFDAGEAQEHWQNIFAHKQLLTKKVKRAVPLRVAMLDYFMKIAPKLKNPKIIELDAFEKLADSTVTDELTSLYNRRFFNETFGRELERGKRYSHPLSLLILDLDDFKKFNDTFGHLCGDRILARIGRLIKDSCRNVDYPCRYGGEEFAVILPQTSGAGALRVGERIKHRLANIRFRAGSSGETFPVTISGGVSTYTSEQATVEDLIATADTALYSAKSAGKDRILIYFLEKRKFIRVAANTAIVYRLLKNGASEPSKVKNIGGGGMLFSADEPIPMDSTIELSIRFPDMPDDIKTVGKVVRVHALTNKKYEIGVHFERLGAHDQDAIVRYVDSFCAQHDNVP